MATVKFKVDTRHPDYGEIKKGEVLEVSMEYAQEYARLGFAEETDAEATRKKKDEG